MIGKQRRPKMNYADRNPSTWAKGNENQLSSLNKKRKRSTLTPLENEKFLSLCEKYKRLHPGCVISWSRDGSLRPDTETTVQPSGMLQLLTSETQISETREITESRDLSLSDVVETVVASDSAGLA